MNDDNLEKVLLKDDSKKIYVYMGTYIYNYPDNDFRISRKNCEFYTPAYSLYRELITEEEVKIELYKEQLFELDHAVIRKEFDTMLESNNYFEYLRDQFQHYINDSVEKPFIKIYKSSEKKTK